VCKDSDFKQICTAIPELKSLFKNHVYRMISAVYKFDEESKSKEKQYEVKNNRIYYKENNGLSSKLNFGYLTNFAYIKEKDGRITDKKELLK
jgi:hypothetical protein